jgi:hypothetical protein
VAVLGAAGIKAFACLKPCLTAMPRVSRNDACCWLTKANRRHCGYAWSGSCRHGASVHCISNCHPLKTVADLAAASDSVLSGVARGELTPAEGHAFSGMLDERRRMIDTQELEQRIRTLEELNKPSTEPK